MTTDARPLLEAVARAIGEACTERSTPQGPTLDPSCAPGSRDPRDVRYEARRRRERSDFRWLAAHCVLLTLAISGVLVKLTQELN